MTKLHSALWAGIIFRLCIAIWNGFFGPSFEAENDALGFHLTAVEYSKNLVLDKFVTGQIYTYFLGAFYSVTTDSLFLGSLLSVVTWAISALTLIRVMRMLSFEPADQFKAMLIYALLPSSILLTSVTLREAYQLLFVNVAIYSALKIYLRRSIVHWLLLIGAVGGMGILHGALLASGVFIIVATLILLVFRTQKKLPLARIVLIVPIVAGCAYLGFSLFMSISYNLEDGLETAVQAYQENTIAAAGRASYRAEVGFGGVEDLLLSIPIFLLQYLFEPMPWRMSALADIVPLFENCLRAWLILRVILSFRNTVGQERRLLLFVFVSYIAMETVWSLGVSNWGTGLRHHIPSIGLLVVAAFAYSGHSQKPRIQGST